MTTKNEGNIVSLGPGSFSWAAAELIRKQERYKETSQDKASSITEACERVTDGRDRFALVPIDNTTDGHIGDTTEFLLDHPNMKIVGEVVMKIDQAIFYKKRAAIKEVVSKDTAIRQSAVWLNKQKLYNTRSVPSTTLGIELAANNESIAGIGSPYALVGLIADGKISEADAASLTRVRGIQSNKRNATIFYLLATDDEPQPVPTGNDKTTFILELSHDAPGELVKVLRLFRDTDEGINLNKIQCIRKENGRVSFLISINGHEKNPVINGILNELDSSEGIHIQRHGSYPAAEYEVPTGKDACPITRESIDILQKRLSKTTTQNQTVIAFLLKDAPGALCNALEAFADEELDVRDIDSGALQAGPEQYFFHLTFTENDPGAAKRALENLDRHCHQIIVLKKAKHQ